jgi:hypothetical protein
VDWRREDSGYLAATVGIVGFVAYLIAANFGLVPSPLAPLIEGAPPAVAAIQAPPDITTAVFVPNPPPPAAVADRPSASHPPATAEVTDSDRPAVRVSTGDGTQVGLTAAPTVKGLASDAGSGVDKVLVTFQTVGTKQIVPASLACGPGRHACSWTAEVPAVLATYSVTATAADEAGNVAKSGSIDVTVVNTGGAVEEVGEVVGRVPGALTDAVDGLLKGLGRVLGS